MQTQYGSDYGRTISISPTQHLAMSRFVSRAYGWMSVGLLVTAFVSFFVASSEAAVQALYGGGRFLLYALLIGEVALVMGLGAAMNRLSSTAATLGFLAYSALNGVTLSFIFLAYQLGSVAQVFFITAGMFGGLALYGSATKKDLTGMGSFVMMGLWGLILVGLVNIFVRSESLSLGMSVVGVIVFSVLTAYDAQRIRMMAYQSTSAGALREESDKGSIFAALVLYLNFINLFLSLLRLFGDRRK